MSIITIREKTVDEKLAEIEAKYNTKYEVIQKRFNNVYLSDGLDQDAKIIIIQDEYKEISDQKDLEILEILGGI